PGLGLHNAGVAVRMQVNETRSDNQPFAIDDARRAGDYELAHGRDAVAFDGHIPNGAFGIAAVIDRSAAKDEVSRDRIGSDKRKGKYKCGGHRSSFPET